MAFPGGGINKYEDSSQFCLMDNDSVKIVSYSIMINGCPRPTFQENRGLRQGDPLSLYLFVLVMDYVTRLLKKLITHSNFKFHRRCLKQHIIQLNFADDLLMFNKGDLASATKLYECFKEFSSVYGLNISGNTSDYKEVVSRTMSATHS
ncbi:uncharacterized protein [Solanum tuberosum]|uniref:uncharacterized protein n=1 Tax=Solanum tuberosum TaxID=4113 RepID=UPI00073A2E74|nr:PREDICTED: uncharacterized protein LOC107060456 [Solanum tuberosum]